jgi:hypothetical protein
MNLSRKTVSMGERDRGVHRRTRRTFTWR